MFLFVLILKKNFPVFLHNTIIIICTFVVGEWRVAWPVGVIIVVMTNNVLSAEQLAFGCEFAIRFNFVFPSANN